MSKRHDQYRRANNKSLGKQFFGIPGAVLNHPDFIRCSDKAKALLLDMGAQYFGHNNGDITIAKSVMAKRGWSSKDKLQNAKNELLERGLIKVSRQGGLNAGPTLYAFTFHKIDECKGKHDLTPTDKAPRNFAVELSKLTRQADQHNPEQVRV